MRGCLFQKVQRLVKRVLPFCLLAFLPISLSAQEKIVHPEISYAGTPIVGRLAGINGHVDKSRFMGNHTLRELRFRQRKSTSAAVPRKKEGTAMRTEEE